MKPEEMSNMDLLACLVHPETDVENFRIFLKETARRMVPPERLARLEAIEKDGIELARTVAENSPLNPADYGGGYLLPYGAWYKMLQLSDEVCKKELRDTCAMKGERG